MNEELKNVKLLTTAEAQELLNVGRTRLFALISSGELGSVRIGSSRRIPLTELERFVDSLISESP
jgi:excisionase family DNA binding protein